MESSVPKKLITSHTQLSEFKLSSAYGDVMSFIISLSHSVRGLPTAALPYPTRNVSPAIKLLLSHFNLAQTWLDSLSPISQSRQGQSTAFRGWYQRFLFSLPTFLSTLLGPPLVEQGWIEVLKVHLADSVGKKQFVDCGTGHELSFLIFLLLLVQLNLVRKAEYSVLVLVVFAEYLKLIEKIDISFWRIEDEQVDNVVFNRQFLGLLFGTAQLVSNPHNLLPASITEYPCIVQHNCNLYLYCSSMHFYNRMKDYRSSDFFKLFCKYMPLVNHEFGWEEMHSSLVQMYQEEVLGDLEVMRHVSLGTGWGFDPAELAAGISTFAYLEEQLLAVQTENQCRVERWIAKANDCTTSNRAVHLTVEDVALSSISGSFSSAASDSASVRNLFVLRSIPCSAQTVLSEETAKNFRDDFLGDLIQSKVIESVSYLKNNNNTSIFCNGLHIGCCQLHVADESIAAQLAQQQCDEPDCLLLAQGILRATVTVGSSGVPVPCYSSNWFCTRHFLKRSPTLGPICRDEEQRLYSLDIRITRHIKFDAAAALRKSFPVETAFLCQSDGNNMFKQVLSSKSYAIQFGESVDGTVKPLVEFTNKKARGRAKKRLEKSLVPLRLPGNYVSAFRYCYVFTDPKTVCNEADTKESEETNEKMEVLQCYSNFKQRCHEFIDIRREATISNMDGQYGHISCLFDGAAHFAILNWLSRPGPLLISLNVHGATNTGYFRDRLFRHPDLEFDVTPQVLWSGLRTLVDGSKQSTSSESSGFNTVRRAVQEIACRQPYGGNGWPWIGLGPLLNWKSRVASPVYIVMAQCYGLDYVLEMKNEVIAPLNNSNDPQGKCPADVIIHGLLHAPTRSQIFRDEDGTIDATHVELHQFVKTIMHVENLTLDRIQQAVKNAKR